MGGEDRLCHLLFGLGEYHAPSLDAAKKTRYTQHALQMYVY